MALFPDEFKSTRTHRIGFAMLGITFISFLLIALGIIPTGPCSINPFGFIAVCTTIIGFPLGCILLIVATIRAYLRKKNAPADNTLTPS